MKQQEYQTMYHFEDNYWWYKVLHEIIEHYIHKFTKNDFTKKILDAGCGTGKLLSKLKDFRHASGFDISQEAINFCKQRKLDNVKVQDINTWNSENNFYDIIVSADVICSIGIEDDLKICEKFYNALNNNGILILNLPALDILSRNHDKAVYIAKRYKRKKFISELQKIGFNIKLSTYRLPFLYLIILLLKLIEPKQTLNEAKSDLKNLPTLVNSFFLFLSRIDNFFIKLGIPNWRGSSLFVIAEKNIKI